MQLNKGFLEEDSLFNAKVGLLLHVLKDLWTGDLAVGGESGVGRGRLSGYRAILDYADKHWEITTEENEQIKIAGDSGQDLERFADAFNH